VTINRNASPSTPLQETLETLCATEQPLYTVRAHILNTLYIPLERQEVVGHAVCTSAHTRLRDSRYLVCMRRGNVHGHHPPAFGP
jgi:hypothetical protein